MIEEKQDNTRVAVPLLPKKIKMSDKVKSELIWKKIKENLENARVYDTRKAEYYKNLQDFQNLNVFGKGLYGLWSRHDYTTPEGQAAIQGDFDYAKDNAISFMGNIVGAGAASATSIAGKAAALIYSKLTKGIFRTPSKNGALGTMKQYTKKGTLGGGAEAIVVDNTPTTVGKMTLIPVEEMVARNLIPNTVPSKYIGYVKDRGTKLPTYVLRKLRILTELTFPKYVDKLDKAMERSGFRRVNDPNVLYRAYTNGQVVVDDVAPGNVGLDWLKRPRMVDFNLQTVPEWIDMGFRLKNGGKL